MKKSYSRMGLVCVQGFRLRIVGHSLGGSSAALLAIMLRKKSEQELGFNPNSISAVGFGTPPCLSKNLAESCSEYVSTIVMQVRNGSNKSTEISL